MSDPTPGLDRESLIAGLNDLIERIRAAEIGPFRISIVGGAALALSHVDRRRTVDVDARLDPHDALVRIAERIAVERDWPADWLNSNASQFFPDWGKSVDWRPLYDRDDIRVEVAPADALLAMKLRPSAVEKWIRELSQGKARTVRVREGNAGNPRSACVVLRAVGILAGTSTSTSAVWLSTRLPLK